MINVRINVCVNPIEIKIAGARLFGRHIFAKAIRKFGFFGCGNVLKTNISSLLATKRTLSARETAKIKPRPSLRSAAKFITKPKSDKTEIRVKERYRKYFVKAGWSRKRQETGV